MSFRGLGFAAVLNENFSHKNVNLWWEKHLLLLFGKNNRKKSHIRHICFSESCEKEHSNQMWICLNISSPSLLCTFKLDLTVCMYSVKKVEFIS